MGNLGAISQASEIGLRKTGAIYGIDESQNDVLRVVKVTLPPK